MKKIQIRNKTHIKQLLYSEWVLGVRDNRYRSFGGFQLWWFDKKEGICNCCESSWSQHRMKVVYRTLEKAANMLWRKRNDIYIRAKTVDKDRKLKIFNNLQFVKR